MVPIGICVWDSGCCGESGEVVAVVLEVEVSVEVVEDEDEGEDVREVGKRFMGFNEDGMDGRWEFSKVVEFDGGLGDWTVSRNWIEAGSRLCKIQSPLSAS